MGLCHEFGSQIRTGCDHPMRAGASACSCAECGVVCRGLFDGCPDVWARGPRPLTISATRAAAAHGAPPALAPASAPAPGGPAGPGVRPEGVKLVRAGAPAAIGPAPRDAAPTDHGAGADRRPDQAHDQAHDRAHDRAYDHRAHDHRAESDGDNGPAGAEAGRDAPGDPRRDVFRWFEEAFEGVRVELQTLIGSMTHQQAMLAELLDSRQAELRLALVAESLPDIVADAVRSAMDEHTAAMTQSADRSHDRFRDDVDQIRADTAASVESLSEAFQKLTGAIAVHDEEAEQRESVRLGTLKGSVTRQITPLLDALAALGARIDGLADQVADSAQPTPPARPPRVTAGPAPAPVPSAAPPAARLPIVPAPAKRVATARSGAKPTPPSAARLVSTARMRPSEPVDETPAAVPRRVSTLRNGASSAPAPRANGSAVPPAGRRVATARVAASKAADAAGPTRPTRPDVGDGDGEETVHVPRVITRRRAPAAAAPLPDEPVVVYELESTDDDAEWAPPAWVSAAASRRSAPTRPAPDAAPTGTTQSRSGITKPPGRGRPTRTPT